MTRQPADPVEARDRKRLRELLELKRRIDTEIADLHDKIEDRRERQRIAKLLELKPPPRRSPKEPADCGTETGYQRHKYLARKFGEGVWPLPAGDPCGCRAAHARHEARRAERRRIESAA